MPSPTRQEARSTALQWGVAPSPLGDCVVVLQAGRIVRLQWQDEANLGPSAAGFTSATMAYQPTVSWQLGCWLSAWWQGTSVQLPMAFAGTALQQSVWQTLQHIPWGERWSYQQVATAVGRPRAVRAVASAIARNPIMLFVPCHRVVRSDGRFGGYRGGDWRKVQLLALEQGT